MKTTAFYIDPGSCNETIHSQDSVVRASKQVDDVSKAEIRVENGDWPVAFTIRVSVPHPDYGL